MKSILILTCCLALASVAPAAELDKHKKKQANQVQQQQPVQPQKVIKPGKHAVGVSNAQQLHTNSQLKMQRHIGKSQKVNLSGVHSNTQITKNKNITKMNVKQFNVQKNSSTKFQPVKFQAGKHIKGSQNWKGTKYVVFRNYAPVWHDQFWWTSHYPRVVLIGGGWYYWNSGWWYPAWGYEPSATFVYDGPIYGYNDLDPGQVVANVQSALQEQGYYEGEVDGLLGPLTRAALARYQADHGLYTTAAIDEPTLESLGFA